MPSPINRLLPALPLLLALIAPATASAALSEKHEPNIGLEKQAPESVLLGSTQKVNLHATNPAGQNRGYNLSFRDVLPNGVKFVAGSSSIAPRVMANKPAVGETTLIWENVSDLSGNSEFNLGYEVEPEVGAFSVNGTYVNGAEAFVALPARIKPRFDVNGLPIEASVTGYAKDEATTKLSAIEITKEASPGPEAELMRGLHDHQAVYTLRVQNNKEKATDAIGVVDYLPAGLEFLGCRNVDNTTVSSTNAGGANPREEYPGSGLITEAPLPAGYDPAKCIEPTEVKTIEVDPPGPQPLGVYTFVRWDDITDLAPGAKAEFQYVAAIPIRRNALFPGEEPSPIGLGQIANLDNNTGPETVDEEDLTNVAEAEGQFEGKTKVTDTGELTRVAEDLAVQKSVDKGTISEGQLSTWTLHIESSEYRFVDNVRIDDLLPNGLCPLGVENYEAATEVLPECTGGKAAEELPSAEYSEVSEQQGGELEGTFAIHWDQTTVPALQQIPPSSEVTITFPTRTRTFYQEEFRNNPAKPVLTGDSWTNSVDIAGQDFAICAPGEPICEEPGRKIFHQEIEGTDDVDHSEAGQEAGGVTIDKTVRENTGKVVTGPTATDCSGTYVDGLAPPLPLYHPGDIVCWTLNVSFAADLFAGTPAVTDFLPPDEEYISNSQAPGPNNTVAATFDETEASGGTLEWLLGESVESGSKVFEYRFATRMTKEPATASKPEEITGNLMKFTYSNTAGETFPLRDRAEIERAEPELVLKKGVYSVGGVPAGGNPPDTNATGAHGGEFVKYRVDLTNEGNLKAEAVEVWDRLPAGITCESIKPGSISNGGTCGAGESIIKWTGLAVGVDAEKTLPSLTYEAKLPEGVAPKQTYENTAGVRQYETETNEEGGEPFHYYPSENIDPAFEATHTPNVAKIRDTATVSTAEASVAKTRTTTLEQLPGNDLANQATIGEGVEYTVTATIPAGAAVFGSPTLIDPLGTRLTLVPGTVKGSVNGVAIPTGGFVVSEEGGNPAVRFPASYTNTGGSGDDLVKLEFEARIANTGANVRGVSVPNTGVLTYKDKEAGGATVEKTGSATIPIVEPLVAVAKSHTGGRIVKPGQIVEYKVTASNSNAANVSAANDSEVVDTVPAGMTPVNGETPIADGGTVEPDGGTWSSGARTITWTISEIAKGASKELHYKLRVNQPANAGSLFKNSVLLTTTSMPGGATGQRTSLTPSHAGYEAKAEDEATLNEATLEKAVEAPKGTTIADPLVYTLKFKLPPQISFFDTTVEDVLPNGIAYDGGSQIKCVEEGGNCDALAAAGAVLNPKAEAGATRLGWYFGSIGSAGIERTLTITFSAHIATEAGGVAVKDKDKLTNKAIGLYNGEPKYPVPTEPRPPADFSSKTEEPTAQIEVLEPKLTIAKTVAGTTIGTKAQPNDPLSYTVEVKNTGDSPAYDAVVEDTNPAGTLKGVEPRTGEGNEFLTPGWAPGQPLKWQIPGPIAPGATVKLSYTATLAASASLHDGDPVDNIADVPTYFGAPKAQRDLEGPTRFREYTEDPNSEVQLEVSLPKLQLKKTAGTAGAEKLEARIGEPFVWQLEATNASLFATIKGVDLHDTLPQGWKYIEGSSALVPSGAHPTPTVVVNGAGEEELSWPNLAILAPGGLLTLRFEAVPTTALIGHEEVFTNHATVAGEDQSGSSGSAEGPYEAEDTAEAELKTPPLTIVKTPKEGTPQAHAVAGEPAAYKLEVKNGGKAEATEVEVTDLLEKGNDYTAGTATANPATGFSEKSRTEEASGDTLVKWAIASIPAEGIVVITVPVSLSPSLPNGTVLQDHATVVSKQQPTPATDDGALDVEREADLELEKTQTRATLNAGEAESYTLKVTNKGPSDATGAVVKDKLPTNVKISGALPTDCAEVGGEVQCAVGDLALGEVREYAIPTQVLSGATGEVENIAKVESPTTDPTPGNNEKTVTATLTTEADVSLKKSGPSAPILLGGAFTYTLEVENAGPSDAQAVHVADALPAEVEGLKAETDTGTCVDPIAAGTVECDLLTMVPGAKATIHVTVKAIAIPAGGEVENEATVTSPTDTEPLNNTGRAKTTVLPAADLAVTKTATPTIPAGGEVPYAIHVVNNGPSDATGVHLTDPLPAGTDFVSASAGCTSAAGTVDCDLGELKVGEARDVTVTVKVPLALAGKDVVNTATVKGNEGDPVTPNDSSTVTTKAGPAADLEIHKTMGQAQAGAPLTYTLAVTNHGPSDSSAVTVKDTLPAGTSFKSATASQGGCAGGQAVSCSLGALAAGASAQVTITVDVSPSATGTLRNSATVAGPESDPDPSNNESAVEGPVAPPAASAPDLHVTKTVSNSSPRVGEAFEYTVTMANRGGVAAKNARLLDTLNGPAKIIDVNSSPGTSCKVKGDGKVTCLVAKLGPGKSAAVTYTVVAERAGGLRNVASAEDGNGEVAPADNKAVRDVKVLPARTASYSLTKTASRKVVPGGKAVSFQISLHVGGTALSDVTVCDRLPKSLVFVKAPGASFKGGEACWTRAFVAAGASVKLHLTARAVRGFQALGARNVATAEAANGPRRSASATVRIKPAFGGKPGGVTG